MGKRIFYELTKTQIIDARSGEVMSDDVSKRSIVANDANEAHGSRKFSKLFQNSPVPFVEKAYNGNLFLLLRWLEQNTNIVLSPKVRGAIADRSDLMEILGVKDRALEGFLSTGYKNLVFAGIRVDGRSGILINPAYALNGHKLTTTMYMLFKDSLAFLGILTKENIENYAKTYRKMNVIGDYKKKLPDRYNKLFGG